MKFKKKDILENKRLERKSKGPEEVLIKYRKSISIDNYNITHIIIIKK